MKNISNEQYNSDQEDINITFWIRTFLRNKFLILSITGIFFIVFSIYSIFRKRLWIGEFEIVLGSSLSKENNVNDFQKLALGGLDSSASALKTEVGILQSPSVLYPVFSFVENEYKKSKTNKLIFSKWRESNLLVNLKKNTSILSISYKDKNIDLILPVLEKISFEYQKYSGKNKQRKFELAKNYLNNQISTYKAKSANSLKIVQEYAMDQDLNISNQIISNNFYNDQYKELSITDTETPSFLFSNTGIEGVRVGAANKIRNIDIQIDKIKNLKDDLNEIQYLDVTIPGLRGTGIPYNLEELEANLAELKSKYTENDLEIKRLTEKKVILINLLKERAIGYLKAQRIITESLMESAIRPKGVILKYKELIREASRDEKTLVQLENNLRKIKLDEAKLEDPWELITKPTLNEDPEGLSIKYLLFFGLLIGIVFGSFVSLIKEKIQGFIFEEEIISNLFGTKVFEIINMENNATIYNSKEVFIEEILKEKEDKEFIFIKCGNIPPGHLNKLRNEFFEKKLKFKLEDNFLNINPDIKVLVICSIGNVTSNDIKNTLDRLEIQKINIKGLVLLKN